MPEEPAAAAASAGGGDSGGAVVDSRVPADLLERSRAALAKWKANHPA
jgi:hypothetical protein